MASNWAVPPSKDTIYLRGFHSRQDPDKIRNFFSRESDSECNVAFFKKADNGDRLFIALKFEDKEAAKEMLERFNNSIILGDSINITYFKDIRKAREQGYIGPRYMKYNSDRFRGSSPLRNGFVPGQFGKMLDSRDGRGDRHRSSHRRRRESDGDHYHRRYTSDSRSRSRSRSRSHSYSSDDRPSRSRTPTRRRSRSPSPRDRRKTRSPSSPDRSVSRDRKSRRKSSIPLPETTPQPSKWDDDHPHTESKWTSSVRERKTSENVPEKTRSSPPAIVRRAQSEGEEEEETRIVQRQRSVEPADQQMSQEEQEVVDEAVAMANEHASQSEGEWPEEGEEPKDAFHGDVTPDQINNGYSEPSRRRASFSSANDQEFDDERKSRSAAKQMGSNGSAICNDLERGILGLPQDKIALVREKKEEIERAYKKDCETFSTAVKMLVSKHPDLESSVQETLRENLKDVGQRCIQELREFIDKLKMEDKA